MIKYLFVLIILFVHCKIYAQHYNLLLKRKSKVINSYWNSSMIAFQLKDKSWEYGEVTDIKKDSIFIKPLMIQYSFLHADTLSSFVTGFALKDIYAFPKSNVRVDYNNGIFRIDKAGSRVQAYWLKSGWILRVGALGYAALNIINSISDNDFSLKNNGASLSIAAAVLTLGIILNKTYKPKFIVGRRYHLELLDVSK